MKLRMLTSSPKTAVVAASRLRRTMALVDLRSKLTVSNVSITHETRTMKLRK